MRYRGCCLTADSPDFIERKISSYNGWDANRNFMSRGVLVGVELCKSETPVTAEKRKAVQY